MKNNNLELLTENLEKGKEYKLGVMLNLLGKEHSNQSRGQKKALAEIEQSLKITYLPKKIYRYDGIKEVFEARYDGRGKSEGTKIAKTAKYVRNIKTLILDLLAQSISKENNNGLIFLSRTALLKEFNMVNGNYQYCKQRTLKLSKLMDIDYRNVEEWYETTDKTISNNIESALKSLRGQALVIWSKEITVALVNKVADSVKSKVEKTSSLNQWGEIEICYKNKVTDLVTLDYREGTKEEKQFILEVERKLLLEMDCEDKGKLIAKGLWEDFKDKANEIVLRKIGIAFYFESYKVIFNPKDIFPAIELNKLYELQRFEKEEQQNIINKEIQDRLYNNMLNRHDKAIERVGNHDSLMGKPKPVEDTVKRRVKEGYIEDNNTLNKTLIDEEAEDITHKVLTTKINK